MQTTPNLAEPTLHDCLKPEGVHACYARRRFRMQCCRDGQLSVADKLALAAQEISAQGLQSHPKGIYFHDLQIPMGFKSGAGCINDAHQGQRRPFASICKLA